MKLLDQGTVVDGFAITECIHAGGMAHIYRVEYADGRESPGFAMAMKIPRMTAGDGAENIVSFEVELQILPLLAGPHVPRFIAAGDLERLPYLVMEYVPGRTLDQWMQEHGRATPEQAARLGVAMAHAAHRTSATSTSSPPTCCCAMRTMRCCWTSACRATRTSPTCWPSRCARPWARRPGSHPSRWWACAATRAAMCLPSA